MAFFDTIVQGAWLWLAGSFLLAVLWTNLARLFAPWAEAESVGETASSLAERIVWHLANWRFATVLFQGLRFLYYVGLPAAALFWARDAVVSRFLGLERLALPNDPSAGMGTQLNGNWAAWAHDLGWAAALGLGSGGLLILARFFHQQAVPNLAEGGGTSAPPVWKTAQEALYHEIHWAFYRNAPIVVLGFYWGTWVGLAIVAVEAVINPAWREASRQPGLAWPTLSQAALAVLSSLIFLYTQNIWLALPVHWGIGLLMRSYAEPVPAPPDSSIHLRKEATG
jgi:hypothetical protein